jgi:hypothetical protein
VDESYKLSVPATGNPLYAQIEVSENAALKSYLNACASDDMQ